MLNKIKIADFSGTLVQRQDAHPVTIFRRNMYLANEETSYHATHSRATTLAKQRQSTVRAISFPRT